MTCLSLNLDRKSVDVLAPPVHQLEDRVRHEDGGEDRDEKSQDERDGESLDGPGPELEEEDRRDDYGQVRVDDRRERLGEAVLDRRLRSTPRPELLPDPLEDEDVRVDRHADGEDEAGDAGKSQSRTEEGHRAEEHDGIQDEGEDRVQPREAVVEEDGGEDEQGTDDGRGNALPDGVEAERRPDGALLEVGQARGQRARAQDEREVVR